MNESGFGGSLELMLSSLVVSDTASMECINLGTRFIVRYIAVAGSSVRPRTRGTRPQIEHPLRAGKTAL